MASSNFKMNRSNPVNFQRIKITLLFLGMMFVIRVVEYLHFRHFTPTKTFVALVADFLALFINTVIGGLATVFVLWITMIFRNKT